MVGGQGGGTFQGRSSDALEETEGFFVEDSASIQNGLKLGAWAPSGKANLVSVSDGILEILYVRVSVEISD